jgi:hypothetical protein
MRGAFELISGGDGMIRVNEMFTFATGRKNSMAFEARPAARPCQRTLTSMRASVAHDPS